MRADDPGRYQCDCAAQAKDDSPNGATTEVEPAVRLCGGGRQVAHDSTPPAIIAFSRSTA